MSTSSRTVLITGASSGIGRACGRHLASRGWRVFGTSRSHREDADGVEMVRMDVDDETSVRQAVEDVHQRAGHIDAVINNAGIAWAGSVEDTTIEEAKAQLETNFFGVLRVCRAVLPIMRNQGSGYIVNISSLAGTFGLPFSGLYSASKFALEGVSESLRFETLRMGIHVVLIEPGDFRTQITESRRIAAAAETNDAYRDAFEYFKNKQEQDEAGAPTPEPIALLAERILNHPRPKLRYPVGMVSQKIVVPLRRILPQRAFEWLACYLMGV